MLIVRAVLLIVFSLSVVAEPEFKILDYKADDRLFESDWVRAGPRYYLSSSKKLQKLGDSIRFHVPSGTRSLQVTYGVLRRTGNGMLDGSTNWVFKDVPVSGVESSRKTPSRYAHVPLSGFWRLHRLGILDVSSIIAIFALSASHTVCRIRLRIHRNPTP